MISLIFSSIIDTKRALGKPRLENKLSVKIYFIVVIVVVIVVLSTDAQVDDQT